MAGKGTLLFRHGAHCNDPVWHVECARQAVKVPDHVEHSVFPTDFTLFCPPPRLFLSCE